MNIVQRAFSDALAEKLDDMFGIHTVYSTAGLASATLAAAAVLGDITHAFATDDALFSADQMQVQAGDLFDGQTVEAIRTRHAALVAAVRRTGAAQTLPPLDYALAPGDDITLLAPLDVLARLRALLR